MKLRILQVENGDSFFCRSECQIKLKFKWFQFLSFHFDEMILINHQLLAVCSNRHLSPQTALLWVHAYILCVRFVSTLPLCNAHSIQLEPLGVETVCCTSNYVNECLLCHYDYYFIFWSLTFFSWIQRGTLTHAFWIASFPIFIAVTLRYQKIIGTKGFIVVALVEVVLLSFLLSCSISTSFPEVLDICQHEFLLWEKQKKNINVIDAINDKR